MAKKSMIQRELKRAKLVAKYAEKRAELKAIIRNVNSTTKSVAVAQAKLNAMPRDAARRGSAVAARSRGGRMACTASSASAVTSCGKVQ